MEHVLEKTVAAFNQRAYSMAAELAEEACQQAQGQDEAFWLGLNETCQGFALIMDNRLPQAEKKLVAAMEKLRHFGYRYNNFEVTSALAGVRKAVEEIHLVRERHKKTFDVTLLPQLRMAAKADD